MEMPKGTLLLFLLIQFVVSYFDPHLVFSPLQIRWDETSTIQRPDRVSPWQIEPAMNPTINPLPVPRAKRPRPSVVTPSQDSSVLTREGN